MACWLPLWHQAINWKNADLLIGPSGTNFKEILIKNEMFSLKKLHLTCKMAAI